MLNIVRNELDLSRPDDVKLFFIKREKDNNRIQYTVYGTQITRRLGQQFISIGRTKIDSVFEQGIEYREYAPLNEPNRFIETTTVQQVGYMDEILSQMENVNLPLFNVHDSKGLWAYAIKIGNTGITFFRKYSENRILTKKGVISLFMDEGEFNDIRSDILTIDGNLDCIRHHNDVYIFNKNKFEEIFSYLDLFINEIDERFTNFARIAPVQDSRLLYTSCMTDPKKIKKLHRVLSTNRIDTLTPAVIREIDTDFGLGLNYTEDGNIVVTNDCIWTVLRLLDDDYLTSPRTRNYYESHSKVKRR